jgi:hypothetical protein
MPRNMPETGNRSSTLEQENKGKMGQVAEQAQQKAKEVTHQAQEQAKSAAEARKERAVEGLGGIARAFRETGEHLRREENDMVAQYSERMANQIERVSSYLEEHSVDDLLRDSEQIARRHPELFLGGAFALGLMLGRFIKSSSERREMVPANYYQPTYSTPTPRPMPPRPATTYPTSSQDRESSISYPMGQSGTPSSSPSSGVRGTSPTSPGTGTTGTPSSPTPSTSNPNKP